MDRQELIKQAYVEAWEGYRSALDDLVEHPVSITANSDYTILLSKLSPMAAQIYRQLSSVTYIKIPPEIDEATTHLLADILEASGVKYVIMPDIIETIPTDDE